MAQNCVKHAKWDSISAWLQTTSDYKPRPHLKEGLQNARSKKEVRKSAIYALKKNKSQRWRPLRSRSAKKKKRWEECGWNRGPHGMPELQPGRDCRDLLPMCVNSGMSPHCSLKLQPSPTHLQETSPHRRKKKHYLPCLLLPLYTAKYMSLWRQRREKNNADCYTMSREQSPAIFSRMRALNESTVLRSSTRPQHNGSFQCVAHAQMKPHSDMLWAGPQFQAPRGAASRGLGIAKANKVPDEALRQDVSPGLQKFHPAVTRNPRKWLTTVPKNNTFLQIISR